VNTEKKVGIETAEALPSKKCRFARCGRDFVPKRANNEYCCPAHKVLASNEKSKQERDLTKPTSAQLKKNWRILKSFYESGQIEVDRDLIIHLGFIHSIHTSTSRKLIKGAEYSIPAYFDYSVEPADGNKYKIVKK
jgi:hypothetical protein